MSFLSLSQNAAIRSSLSRCIRDITASRSWRNLAYSWASIILSLFVSITIHVKSAKKENRCFLASDSLRRLHDVVLLDGTERVNHVLRYRGHRNGDHEKRKHYQKHSVEHLIPLVCSPHYNTCNFCEEKRPKSKDRPLYGSVIDFTMFSGGWFNSTSENRLQRNLEGCFSESYTKNSLPGFSAAKI